METIASLWWLWAILGFSCGLATMLIHIRNMKKSMMGKSGAEMPVIFFQSIYIIMIGGVITSTFWVLFLIAILINLIKLIKA